MIFSLLFWNDPDQATKGPVTAGLNETILEEWLANSLAQNPNLSGAIALVDVPGQVDWLAASGWETLGNEQQLSRRHQFALGSLAEPLFATITMQLVEEGELGIDDLVSNWIDVHIVQLLTDGHADQLTVRHLLNHSSGIFDSREKFSRAEDNWGGYREEELRWVLENGVPTSLPGEEHFLSRTNYLLLSLVIEELTGQSLGQLLQERLFEPLGMRQSLLSQEQGVMSSASDLRRFMHALSSGSLFRNPSSLPNMLPGKKNGYGLGLKIYADKQRQGWAWGAEGRTIDTISYLFYLEECDAIITFIGKHANADFYRPSYFIDKVCNHLKSREVNLN